MMADIRVNNITGNDGIEGAKLSRNFSTASGFSGVSGSGMWGG